MSKTKPGLEEPFKVGEKVITTKKVQNIDKGSKGKIKLANGLGAWQRYWVKFSNGEFLGHLDNSDLVRPGQMDLWLEKKKQSKKVQSEEDTVSEKSDNSSSTSANSNGIPEALLERSRKAKERKLG